MKNVQFHFIFPSKYVIVTFVISIGYINIVVTYVTIIITYMTMYTFTTKITHRTNLNIVVKIINLDTSCIYSHNH
jgi:hypothetical protein